MALTLIADDLTGACDAGALFTGRGPVGVFIDAGAAGAIREVVAVDTETRALAPAAARERVRAAAARLGERLASGLVFKKIDSTMRGPVGEEIEAVLQATGRSTALVCPAFPDHGRTVDGGLLRIDGALAHESAVGRDPAYPGATSDVAQILGRGVARPVCHVAADRVRRGPEALGAALAEAAGAIVSVDAQSDADLDVLADAAASASDLVVAGSAGLARAVAQRLGHAGPAAPLPDGSAWLVVAGSLHPASRRQIAALEAAGAGGVVVDVAAAPDLEGIAARLAAGRPAFLVSADAATPGLGARRAVAAALADAARRVLEMARPDLVLVTGGDTAYALMSALGAECLELSGAPASGLALGELIVDGAPRLPVLTKAGGFGAIDLFVTLLGGRV